MTKLRPMYVVILTMNLREDTIACLESVRAAGVDLAHIIVVDNASIDDTPDALAARYGSELALIRNRVNLGCGGGVNRGVGHALGQGAASVLVLNNDTIVDQDMIRCLVELGEQIDHPDILAPAIFYHDAPDRLWRLGDMRHKWLPMARTIKMDRATARQTPPMRVDYVTGCAMLVRREVFEKIGLYDTHYYMYFEDPDFCRRAEDAGFEVWVVPQAQMLHKVSSTTASRGSKKNERGSRQTTKRRDKPFYRYWKIYSQLRFYHSHPHGPSALLREAYLAYKLGGVWLSDIFHGNWDLMRPFWDAVSDGYREHWTGRAPTQDVHYKAHSDPGEIPWPKQSKTPV